MKNRLLFYFTAIAAGSLVTLLIQFKDSDDIERNYFDSLAQYIRSSHPVRTEDSIIVDALHLTHELLSTRQRIFRDRQMHVSSIYNGTLTMDLLTAEGAC